MIRIILAESNEIIRNGLKLTLSLQDQFQIVGELADHNDAMALLKNGIHADILLTDIYLTGEIDRALIKKINQASPLTRIIAFTERCKNVDVLQAFKSGVSGYLLKDIKVPELMFGIEQVGDKKNYLCNKLAAQLVDRLLDDKPFFINDDVPNVDFSKRELEVLNLIADGFTNQEIANRLFTSRRTIEGHRQSLIDKSGVKNAPALIGFAVRNGIIN